MSGTIDDTQVDSIAIDTATAVACIAATLKEQHLNTVSTIRAVRTSSAVALRSANGAPMHVRGLIRFEVRRGKSP